MTDDKIDMNKFDDLSSSEIIKKYREYGIDAFPEADRKAVLDMLMKHERNQKTKEVFLKMILALFTLVPTVLLWLNGKV